MICSFASAFSGHAFSQRRCARAMRISQRAGVLLAGQIQNLGGRIHSHVRTATRLQDPPPVLPAVGIVLLATVGECHVDEHSLLFPSILPLIPFCGLPSCPSFLPTSHSNPTVAWLIMVCYHGVPGRITCCRALVYDITSRSTCWEYQVKDTSMPAYHQLLISYKYVGNI